MLFKSLRLFRFTKSFDLSPEDIGTALESKRFHACASTEMFSCGWASPLGRRGSELVHAADGRIMVCLRREDKLLPATVIRQMVEEKVDAIEQAEGRKVRRKERDRLRDEVTHDLLPRALARSAYTFAYIAARDGWLVVNNASVKKADELVSLLRESLGTLPLRPLETKISPAAVMTRWLQGTDLPADFALSDECELRDIADQAALIRCKRQDLGADDVQALLNGGRQTIKLAIAWEDRLSCVLSEDLSMRRLRFEDVVQEEFGQIDRDDEAACFDAEFAMMALELARFITRLIEAFGGEALESYARSA